MTENQGLDQVLRESYITLNILLEWLCHTAIAYEPLEIAEFTRAVSEFNLAVAKTHVQLQALARAKNAPR
jgi:hypothetical protein